MKYNILDFIACPSCKHFPLKLHETKICEEDAISSFDPPYKCERYCGYRGEKITNVVAATICKECYSKTIEDGILFCKNCNTSYQIKCGIAKLITDVLKSEDELQYLKSRKNPVKTEGIDKKTKRKIEIEEDFILKAKKTEMDVRNRPMNGEVVENLSSKKHQFMKQIEFKAVDECLDIRKDDLVLDAGCGYGVHTLPISQRCKYVIATDFAFNTLKIFKTLSNNEFSTVYLTSYETFPEAKICLIQADICHLPFRKDFQFSKVLSTQVISHIPLDEKINAMGEIYNYLRKNGIFVLTVGNDFLFWRLLRILKLRNAPKKKLSGDDGYFYKFKKSEFKNILMMSGFSVKEIYGIQIFGYMSTDKNQPFLNFLERKIQHTIFSTSLGNLLLAKGTK